MTPTTGPRARKNSSPEHGMSEGPILDCNEMYNCNTIVVASPTRPRWRPLVACTCCCSLARGFSMRGCNLSNTHPYPRAVPDCLYPSRQNLVKAAAFQELHCQRPIAIM